MPIINFNTFAIGGDEDVQAVVEGIEYSRRAFADVIPLDGGFTEFWPGSSVESTEEIAEYVRNESWGHHASCTCPIGADDDPNAVLDTNFNVRGTKNLRVVDASVFPKIPGFYVAQPIYLIAEKASDVIIQAANAS
jgi:choline dehydrogenase